MFEIVLLFIYKYVKFDIFILDPSLQDFFSPVLNHLGV